MAKAFLFTGKSKGWRPDKDDTCYLCGRGSSDGSVVFYGGEEDLKHGAEIVLQVYNHRFYTEDAVFIYPLCMECYRLLQFISTTDFSQSQFVVPDEIH